jgi:hypothetical protein
VKRLSKEGTCFHIDCESGDFAEHKMLSSDQNPEECDATGDAMKYRSWVYNYPEESSDGLFILKISPFPCLYKIGPGGGIEDVHGRRLTLVYGAVGDFIKLDTGGFSTIAGNSFQ